MSELSETSRQPQEIIRLSKDAFPEEGLYEELLQAVNEEANLGALWIGIFGSRAEHRYTPYKSDVDLFVNNPLADGEKLPQNASYGASLADTNPNLPPVGRIHVTRMKVTEETLKTNVTLKGIYPKVKWIWFKSK